MASSRSSGLKSADAMIANGHNRINAITVLSDGTNAATLIVYDNNASATGTVLAKIKVTGAELQKHVLFENPVYAEVGLYADISGTGAEYIVYFGG